MKSIVDCRRKEFFTAQEKGKIMKSKIWEMKKKSAIAFS